MWCLGVAVLVGISAGKAWASPCTSLYADWVMEPSVFVRTDEPKHLQGLHVVCAWRSDESTSVNFEAYTNAVDTGAPPLRGELRLEALKSWRDFRRELRLALRFTKRSNNWEHLELKQPFGVFAASGKRLGSVEEVLEAQLVLVAEGGQWFWPPVRKGFVRQVSDGLELETMSVQPVLFRVRGFLRDEECTEIVKVSDGRMGDSPVSLMNKDKGRASKEFRTSTQARIAAHESKYLDEINKRIVRLTHVPLEHNEDVQILRYEKTGYYGVHLDNWDPKFYSGQDTSFMQYGHNNRLITVFWYLTNVSEGGETMFPRADGLPGPADNFGCDQGLKVKPERGAVIFWYSLRPNGNTDDNAGHAACPVLGDEEKWAANYWVWNKPRTNRPLPDDGVDEEEPGERNAASPRGEPAQGKPAQAIATFYNKHPTEPIEMSWLNSRDNSEVKMGVVPPGGEQTMNSFPGHTWLFKTGPSFPHKWTEKVTIGAEQTQQFTFNPRRPNEDL